MINLSRLLQSLKTTGLIVLFAGLVFAQSEDTKNGKKTNLTKTGVLLLAHGGKQNWNDEVVKLAAVVDRKMPAEVAFGMATRRNIQAAVDRLAARGVDNIIAVPLFISSHSSVITSTEYLLGQRAEAPRELAIFAKMDHGHGAGHGTTASFDQTAPIKSPIPIRMLPALDAHPLVADILLSRAVDMSRQPEKEVVVVVAHGPVSDETNKLWLESMASLATRMRAGSKFRRIEYLTVRDDAPEPIRARATEEFRKVVKTANDEKSDVLIVPLLLSYGGIEDGIRKRLEGLDYRMSDRALLPDDRLGRWVLLSVEESVNKKVAGAR